MREQRYLCRKVLLHWGGQFWESNSRFTEGQPNTYHYMESTMRIEPNTKPLKQSINNKPNITQWTQIDTSNASVSGESQRVLVNTYFLICRKTTLPLCFDFIIGKDFFKPNDFTLQYYNYSRPISHCGRQKQQACLVRSRHATLEWMNEWNILSRILKRREQNKTMKMEFVLI